MVKSAFCILVLLFLWGTIVVSGVGTGELLQHKDTLGQAAVDISCAATTVPIASLASI